jgi:hypothetical protein
MHDAQDFGVREIHVREKDSDEARKVASNS